MKKTSKNKPIRLGLLVWSFSTCFCIVSISVATEGWEKVLGERVPSIRITSVIPSTWYEYYDGYSPYPGFLPLFPKSDANSSETTGDLGNSPSSGIYFVSWIDRHSYIASHIWGGSCDAWGKVLGYQEYRDFPAGDLRYSITISNTIYDGDSVVDFTASVQIEKSPPYICGTFSDIEGYAEVVDCDLQFTGLEPKEVYFQRFFVEKVPLGWSGTVTPIFDEHDMKYFFPSSRTYHNVQTSQINQVFIVDDNPFVNATVSGYVKSAEGLAVPNALLSVSFPGFIQFVNTDQNGYYQVDVYEGWSGTITPVYPDHLYNPDLRSFNNLNTSVSEQDFAIVQNFTISGIAKTSSGSLVPDVMVTASNGGGATTTSADGTYSLTVPSAWTGTITATKPGYAFPERTHTSGITANQTAQDFISPSIFIDDFNDNSMNNQWAIGRVYDDCDESDFSLNETNGHLEFMASLPPVVEPDWNTGAAFYYSNQWYLDVNQDFAFKINYHHAQTTEYAEMLLGIAPFTVNPEDIQIDIYLSAECFYGDKEYAFWHDTESFVEEDYVERTTDGGSLYISYEASADELYLSYTGYGAANAWKTVSGVLKDQWGGAPIYLGFGGAAYEGTTVTAGTLYLDDFVLDAGTMASQYALNIGKTGNGSVRINGTTYSLPWSGSFVAGSIVTLEAVPDSDWSFTAWSGDEAGNTNPVVITMDSSKNMTAVFLLDSFLQDSDITKDNKVDFRDLVVFSENWLLDNCEDLNNWCNWADINRSGSVGADDLQIMADDWLKGATRESVIFGIESPDFNGDGKADILWELASTGANFVTLMDGMTCGPLQYVPDSRGFDLDIIDIADFDGDGKADLLWELASTGAKFITLMDGGVRGPLQYIPDSRGFDLDIVDLADFNNDKKADILWTNVKTGAMYITLMDGGVRGVFQYIPDSKGFVLNVVDLADFNGDGKADILWRNTMTGASFITLMDGGVRGAFQYIADSKGFELNVVDLADFNGDGKADLLWRNVATGAYTGTLMDGVAIVETKGLGGSSSTLQIAGLADFNHDGKTDILWRNVDTGAYVGMLMNGVTSSESKELGGSTTTLQVAGLGDFNADGMMDLVWRNVTTGSYMGTQMDGLTMGQNKSFGGSTTTLQIVTP